MRLTRFKAHDVKPELFVNRLSDREWLSDMLMGYLGDDGADGMVLCVIGDKGVGKSILTRRVLLDVHISHSTETVIVEVDCRRHQRLRAVLSDAASQLVRELEQVKAPAALIETARVTATIARFTDASQTEVHEHLQQHRRAAGLAGSQSLLSMLKTTFDISVERGDKQIRSLSGAVRFDDTLLCEALLRLIEDIRAQGIKVVLYVDNVDELQRHDYHDEKARLRARRDVEGILFLMDAPAAVVLNMRTYYAGILSRQVEASCRLEALPPEELLRVLHKRLEREPHHEQLDEWLSAPERRQRLQMLAEAQPTPLAFLDLFYFLMIHRLFDAPLPEAIDRYLHTHYATVPSEVIRRVAAAFQADGPMLPRAQVLQACDGNEALLAQLQDRQVVLPQDFWNPQALTLEPQLAFFVRLNALAEKSGA